MTPRLAAELPRHILRDHITPTPKPGAWARKHHYTIPLAEWEEINLSPLPILELNLGLLKDLPTILALDLLTLLSGARP